jgi:hypothetical protein
MIDLPFAGNQLFILCNQLTRFLITVYDTQIFNEAANAVAAYLIYRMIISPIYIYIYMEQDEEV